jgi:hypothetical protein
VGEAPQSRPVREHHKEIRQFIHVVPNRINAILEPSGDQSGLRSFCGLVVNRVTADPSGAIVYRADLMAASGELS